MKTLARNIIVAAALLLVVTDALQADERDDQEALKIAAMEALVSAPPERALPLVDKVLAGNNSVELKERALFILSQIDEPAAHSKLLEYANGADGELKREAIRMIGIGGNDDSISQLKAIYDNGDFETREAVIEAFMIADDRRSVFDIALTAEGDDFTAAVDMLGIMGAREELRQLSSQMGASKTLIDAYAISGDFESLRALALDSKDSEIQAQAIEAMGIVGGDEVNETLIAIYRDATTDEIRKAALDGMLIANHEQGVLELYRSSDDAAMKKEFLEYLVIMGSEEVWNIIDSTLSED